MMLRCGHVYINPTFVSSLVWEDAIAESESHFEQPCRAAVYLAAGPVLKFEGVEATVVLEALTRTAGVVFLPSPPAPPEGAGVPELAPTTEPDSAAAPPKAA